MYVGQLTHSHMMYCTCMTPLQVIKKALSLSPGDHTHWNLLGVIAAHSGT